MSTRNRVWSVALVVGIAALMTVDLFGQAVDRPDLDAIYKIKDEGFRRSKVMEVESYLTDVYGPRLTGSPNLKLAGAYAQKQLVEYGLTNVHLEKFRFGRGWSNERFYVHAIAPQAYPLIGFVKAWTPGTQGLVTAEVVDVSDIQSEADFTKYHGKLAGKFVLTEPLRAVQPPFGSFAHRLTDAELLNLANAPDPTHHRDPVTAEFFRKKAELNRTAMQFFIKEGALVLLEPSPDFGIADWPRPDGGTVFQSAGERSGSPNPKDPAMPTMVVLAAEHYNRMMRTLQKGIPVTLEMNIQNKFYDDDLDAFNVIGEIPGTDKADELVMLGAHLDSWHMGTGATDNGSGVAVMMEAVRILKATGLKMRRTVRIGLWSGEEQGMLGSKAYVKEHFYDQRTGEAKPEYEKLSAYFNEDAGAGAIRALSAQSNEAVAPIFKAWMEPFRNMGMTTVMIKDIISTDHVSFDSAGLPGFMFMQDPLDYFTRTHHTNMDLYDRVQPADMMGNAVIVASFIYHTANRDQLLPRKPMPTQRPQATH